MTFRKSKDILIAALIYAPTIFIVHHHFYVLLLILYPLLYDDLVVEKYDFLIWAFAFFALVNLFFWMNHVDDLVHGLRAIAVVFIPVFCV